MSASAFRKRILRRVIGTLGCAAVGMGGTLLRAQQPRLVIDCLIEQDKRLSVYVDSSQPSEIELNEEEFETYQFATPIPPTPFSLYYKCNERLLTPEPQSCCYLHLFFFRTQDRHSRAGVTGWYQRDRLTTKGAFVDQPIQLKARIIADNLTYENMIPLTVHQKVPQDALEAEFEIVKLDVSSGRKTRHALRFANPTGCSINIIREELQIEDPDPKLWFPFDPKTTSVKKVPPAPAPTYFPALDIALQPRSNAAFWKSLWPYSEKTPHDLLRLKVPFEVEGGYRAETIMELAVEFKPKPFWLILAVIIGSLFSALLSFLASPGGKAKRKKRSAPASTGGAGEPASSPAAALREGASDQPAESPPAARRSVSGKASRGLKRIRIPWKDILLRVAMALVAFMLYIIIKGGKEVVLFDLDLDPTQLLPAFLIGLFVGMRPVLMLNKLLRLIGLENGAAALVVAAMIGFAGPAGAAGKAGGPPFLPLTLSYHAPTNTLYSLGAAAGSISVYRLDCDAGRLDRIADVDRSINPVDSCLVEYGPSLWLAIIGQRAVGLIKSRQPQTPPSISTLVLVQLRGESPRIERMHAKMGAWGGGYSGVTYDADRQRLLVTDSDRASIYAIRILPTGLDPKEERVFTDSRLRLPGRLLLAGAEVLIADSDEHRLFRWNPSTGAMTECPGRFEEIAGLAYAAATSRLFVADAGKPAVLAFDMSTPQFRQILALSGAKEPRAVAVDREGRIWVADPGASAILLLSTDGRLLGRFAPEKEELRSPAT